MHVAINAAFWNQPNTGSGQYTRQLVYHLNRMVSDLTITLVYPQVAGQPEPEAVPPRLLVNNAGILMFKDLASTTAADLRRVLEVYAVGTFNGMRAVAPHMIRQRSGSIINNSSCDGISPANSLVAYASSKFAVRGMTKVAALELGPHGVRVNSCTRATSTPRW